MESRKTLPFTMALIANVIWGFSFIASKISLEAWGPFTASALRFGIASLILYCAFFLFKKRIEVPQSSMDWVWLFLVGTTGFGLLYPLQMAGLKFIPSSLSACIMLTSPLFVVMFGIFFLRESFSQRKLMAVMLGIFGGILLLQKGNSSVVVLGDSYSNGLIFTLLSSLSLSASIILTRKLSSKLNTEMITFWSMAIGFFELTIAAFVFEEQSLATIFSNVTAHSFMAIIFLAAFCSAVCFFIWNLALARASVKEIACTMHIKTPVAILTGIAIAGEEMTWPVLVGTSVVMAGIYLSQTSPSDSSFKAEAFQPDIIIEATSVCNRSCSACYAPNVVSVESAEKLMRESPEYFLSPENLKRALVGVKKSKLISIRGGEPSLHPQLPELFKLVTSKAKRTVLETHGRWILKSERVLLEAVKENKIIVKISFDKMHSLSKEDLMAMTETLEMARISYLIAITEESDAEANLTRLTCSWVPDSKIVFQIKATSLSALMTPVVGVINVDGILNRTVTAKPGFSLSPSVEIL